MTTDAAPRVDARPPVVARPPVDTHPQSDASPRATSPPTTLPAGSPLLELRDIHVGYVSRRGWLSRGPVLFLRAVDGVDLAIAKGEAFGLVGESGCGKSTLARAIVGLQEPTAGEIRYAGERIDRPRPRWVPRKVQIVFQDPYSSLNPRMTVAQTLGEMLRVHRVVPPQRVEARIDELIDLVGLGRSTRHAYPRQLSGGQRQRVGIARALSLEPEVLVADEPVSALDVSVQATILGLLEDLRARLGLTLLLIAHDLAVVRQVCERVAVMYLGRIVEEGPVETIFADPRHPYTQALLRAVPSLRPGRRRTDVAVRGEPPSPYALPPGCRFDTRCPVARERCLAQDPPLRSALEEHAGAGATGPGATVAGDQRPGATGSGTPGPEPSGTRAAEPGPSGPVPAGHRVACHFAWRPPSPGDGRPVRRDDPEAAPSQIDDGPADAGRERTEETT